MDADAIFKALAVAEAATAESDPFSDFANTAEGIGELLIKQSPQFDIKDNLLAGLITGLAGGFAENRSNNYRSQQKDFASDVLFSALQGGDVLRPEGMNASVFAPLEQTGKLFQLDKKLAAEQAVKDLEQKKLEIALTEIGKNPYRAEAIRQGLGLTKPQPLVKDASVEPDPTTKTSTIASPGRDFESYLKEYSGDEAMAKSAYETDLKRPKELEDEFTSLRKEFEGKAEVKNYILADVGLKAMREAIKDPSATSDVELIRRGIQAIEPGLAVRTDDQTAVYESTSIPGAWKAQIVRALNGESGLSPEVRNGLLKIAERSHKELSTNFNQARDYYVGEARRKGIAGDVAEGISYMGKAQIMDNPASEIPVVPPGMKLQQNKTTGEYRVVPK